MEEVYLVIPSVEHKEEYNEMLLEWKKTKEHIYPGAINPKGMDYINWLKNLETYKTNETCPSHLVPSDTFFLVDKHNKVFGAISIRHYLNEQLLKFAGHIGYGIRPTERRKGYAKVMLKMALEKCKNIGITQILITCDKYNIASAKTIIANGGIFENELIEDDGNVLQRYWIEL
ncbi:GNAT family N-acetyltransferase [Clostridium tagluense]|uniref:GNAT family N-acetyltransferase n=1 Tax=Clostridium tagluense TaxID=360422 RepID=UPI001CF455F2|nr:GNAT family N-acetyltransferase [Clostridium tagluense]MCB2299299.1 GNAT family N-acetyltransferase [Clostridium tagluense]